MDALVGYSAIHHLCPLGRAFHMAMRASLVTVEANVQLEDLCWTADKWGHIMFLLHYYRKRRDIGSVGETLSVTAKFGTPRASRER